MLLIVFIDTLKIVVVSFKTIISWLIIVLWLQLCCCKFYAFTLQFTTAVYTIIGNTAWGDCRTKTTRQWRLSVHKNCPDQAPLVQAQTSEKKKKKANILQYKLIARKKNTAFLCFYICFWFLRTTHMKIKTIFSFNSL